jgi:hypothetical protein
MKVQIVEHYQIHQRYKIQFERSAVKGVDGYKIEANADTLDDAMSAASSLKAYAELKTAPTIPAVTNG